MSTPEEVPEEWCQIGFSGEFVVEATLTDMLPGAIAEFEAKLPTRVPFGTNSDWLALRLNHDVDPPTVVLVREWHAAIMDTIHVPSQLRLHEVEQQRQRERNRRQK